MMRFVLLRCAVVCFAVLCSDIIREPAVPTAKRSNIIQTPNRHMSTYMDYTICIEHVRVNRHSMFMCVCLYDRNDCAL